MIPRLARKLTSVEILGPVLVVVALQMLSYGISSSLRETNTTYLFLICLSAAVLGWVFSKSKLRGSYSAVILILIGWTVLWIIGARLALPLLSFLKSTAVIFPQIIPALKEKLPIDATEMQDAWTVAVQTSNALVLRWQIWLRGIGKSVTINDALIQSMIWSFVMWCLAAWAGWYTARRNAIAALLPSIGLMAIVLSYSEYRIYSLWLIVILMLLLMGLWNYKNHTIQWAKRRVDYSDSILYDNAQAVIFLALLIGTIAFSTPSISWRVIRDAWQNRNKNEAAEVLGVRQQIVVAKKVPAQKPSLPREHLLTEGFAQSKELVMIIRTGELPPVPNPSFAEQAPHHYWRSTTYDDYTGAGWVTNKATAQNYNANTPLVAGLLDGYKPLHMEVSIQQPEGKLFWSGLLYSVSVPFRADWRVHPQSNLFADQTALLESDMFIAASGATSYGADSYIPNVTVERLRKTSTDYPDWIRARYLQLPGELPARTRQLAEKITAGIDNPYDKAKAIEHYLRENYPYDLNVPKPPEGQDVADYFLFDLKRGYCDYYATAMVILARASGLPARFVSGYSSGSYDPGNAEYVVRELNAHSWAEVYFPEIGWIEFEPTASQPEIDRIENEPQVPNPVTPDSPTRKFLYKLTHTGILYWVSPFVVALLAAVLYFALLERIWVLSRAPSSAIVHLYQRYYRLGRPLAGERTRAETASEFTHKLIHNTDVMYNRPKQDMTSASIKENAQHLTNLYLLSTFSDHLITRKDVGITFNRWRHLRRQLLIAKFKSLSRRAAKRLRFQRRDEKSI